MMTESPQLNQVELDSQLGFASDDDSHVPYMKRTRDWYMALGYNNPYRYAHYIDVPFQPLKKALSESTVTLMTTAAPFQPDKGPQGPGAPYNPPPSSSFLTKWTHRKTMTFEFRMWLSIASTRRWKTATPGSRCR